MAITSDLVKSWLYQLTDEILPPFCAQIILHGGLSFYIHSVIMTSKDSESMLLRIWDTREMSENDVEKLKHNLNKIPNRKFLQNIVSLHPKLDWANMRVDLREVAACVEWHDRLWPETKRPRDSFKRIKGFSPK